MRFLIVIFLVLALVTLIGCGQPSSTPAPAPSPGSYWTCSMHPQIHEAAPGKCPICGMDLIEKQH